MSGAWLWAVVGGDEVLVMGEADDRAAATMALWKALHRVEGPVTGVLYGPDMARPAVLHRTGPGTYEALR